MFKPEGDELRSDKTRAVAFSDGVFAIVITLLVLDLRVPDVPKGQMWSGLLAQWPGYVAYIASFLYVAVVWLNHKAAFNRIKCMDRGLRWANLGVLFFTALLPFPTLLVSHALREDNLADQRTAVVAYALASALLCTSWLVFFHYLAHHQDLAGDNVDERFFPGERVRMLIGIVLYAVAGALGHLIAPLIALAVFVAVPIFYALTSTGLYKRQPTQRAR